MKNTIKTKVYKSEFGDIYYESSGPKEAPVVIFIHGVGMDHRTFEKQVEVLKDNYRVIVWDLPGHGRSTLKENKQRYTKMAADCLYRLMTDTGVNKAVLVGQSLGSIIEDLFFIRKSSVKWQQKVSGSKCFKILSANHITNQDNPKELNEALVEFLNAIQITTKSLSTHLFIGNWFLELVDGGFRLWITQVKS